jgi:hypothetical protein
MGEVEVVEKSIVSKTENPEDCEDGLVVTEDFAAIIDGATDKSGRRYNDLTGGRFAMLIVADALNELPAQIDAHNAVDQFSAVLNRRLQTDLLPAEDLPSAVATIYSAARREIWQIGDVGFWFAGRPIEQPRKRVDQVNSAMRAAVLKAELLSGASLDDLADRDPGREAILPLLTRQGRFANNLSAGELAYAALDGRTVPDELISVEPVPDDVVEVVIASDGYPLILPTLAEAEIALAELLIADPLCIDQLSGTKAPSSGKRSFDDRTYLRFAIPTAGQSPSLRWP